MFVDKPVFGGRLGTFQGSPVFWRTLTPGGLEIPCRTAMDADGNTWIPVMDYDSGYRPVPGSLRAVKVICEKA
jgi:hypothetical protein